MSWGCADGGGGEHKSGHTAHKKRPDELGGQSLPVAAAVEKLHWILADRRRIKSNAHRAVKLALKRDGPHKKRVEA